MKNKFAIAVAMFLSLCCSQLSAQTLTISGVLELETGFDGLGVDGQDLELNLDLAGQTAALVGGSLVSVEASSFSLTIGGVEATTENGAGLLFNTPAPNNAALVIFPLSSAALEFTIDSNDILFFGGNLNIGNVVSPTVGSVLAADALENATLSAGVADTVLRFTDPNTNVVSDYTFEQFSTLKGDVDLSGSVDFLDIAPFIAALSSGDLQAEADVNCDGVVSFLDIAPFIAILSGS